MFGRGTIRVLREHNEKLRRQIDTLTRERDCARIELNKSQSVSADLPRLTAAMSSFLKLSSARLAYNEAKGDFDTAIRELESILLPEASSTQTEGERNE